MNYKKFKEFSKRRRYIRLKPLVLAMSTIIPVTATADIVIDPDRKQQENVAKAANGTPLININDANSKGISHNKYSDFNVNQQGVIFNNSMQDGVSKTGGFAIKNNNLSSEAKVILNEVTGARGSHLAGSMEVFGRTADLIVANENGITVNGVSTVNASNLTLSTGKVNFDQNGDIQLAVERGAVSIEGQGINTDGLSYFDIVSRSATLAGEIAGEADIKIVTGLNNYNTSTRTHSVRSPSGVSRPEVAISGTQLGSMYGNRIQLISTESGAGVTHQGSIIGSKGIEISADGEISLASVVSDSDSVTIAGRSIALGKQAGKGGVSAQADVTLTALTNMTIAADIVAEQGTIRINAVSLLQSAANLLAKSGVKGGSAVPAIQINVADRYVINGALYAVDSNNNRIDGAQVVLSQGKFVVKVGGKTISNATIISDASLVSTSGDIAIRAGTLENNRSIIAAQNGSLVFNLTDALVNEGYVQANGSVTLTGKRAKNSGVFSTTNDLKLTLGTLENSGTMYAGRVTVTANEAVNQGIILTDKGDIDLQIQGKMQNSDTLQASSAVKIKAQELQNDGVIAAAATTELSANSLANSGTIQGKNVSSVTEKLTNSGNVLATSGDINLKVNGSDDIVNSGTFQADNAISLQGKTLLNQGGIVALQGALDLNLSDQLDNSGALYGKDIQIASEKLVNSGEAIAEEGHLYLTVRGDESVINTGILQAKTSQIATKGELDNQGTIATQESLHLSAEKITNSSEVISYGDMELTAGSELVNLGEEAIISANKMLTIRGEKPDSLAVNNSEGAVIQSTEGDIAIHSFKALNNSKAAIKASGTIAITDIDSLSNTDGELSGSNIRLQNINTLQNTGTQAVINAEQNLTVSDIDRIDNKLGTIAAWQDATFSNIRQFINSAAKILAKNTIRFESLGSLTNSDKAEIDSELNSVLFNAVENLSNLSDSLIRAKEEVALTHISSLKNSEKSQIYSFGDMQLAEIKDIENTAKIVADAGLLLRNINRMMNDGAASLVTAIDIIIENVTSLVNRNAASVKADDTLKISGVNTLLNEDAGYIEAQYADVSADNVTNAGYESIIAGNEGLIITAKEVNNNDQALMVSDNSKTAEILINAASLNNSGGKISAAGSLTINTVDLNNSDDGSISGSGSLTLNKQGDLKYAEGKISSKGIVNFNVTGDVFIDKEIESFGSVNITASNIYNNNSIISAGSIYLEAINIVNNINSLIYAIKDATFIASGKISNLLKGNILSQGYIVMEAESIHNQAGVIRSEGDMWLDAKNILNESTYKGESWDYSALETGYAEQEEGGATWGKTHSVNVSIPGLASDIALDVRAEISSGSNLYINQDSNFTSTVNNKGGLIQAKNDIRIRGDLYNTPGYLDITMLSYLKTPLAKDIELNFFYWKSLWTNRNPTLYFTSLYEMLDFMYGQGSYSSPDEVTLDSDSKWKFSNALRELGSSHSLLNGIMNKIFGEQWKSSDYSYLVSRWSEVNEAHYATSSGEDGQSSPVRTTSLQDMKIYFMPAEKAAISAGGNIIHTGGSFNNGIASELASDLQENKAVTVEVDGKDIETLEQGYEVKFNRKNIEVISKGISTLPTIGELTDIKGLFGKSKDFITYLSSLDPGSASVQTANARVESESGATYKVVPVYETLPSMIDKSQYYGSDYFFDAVGYKSEQPVLVIGDNYFISELIRRQATESLGTFMSEKYHVEGAGLAQMFFDNAAELVASEAGASLVVGQPLTQEQIDSLEQDIVWFVTELVEGYEVLVPKIYLSSKTLNEIKDASETGIASVHAGDNVIVDATKINNNNAVISANKDVSLVAAGDINNISSGMNAGIKAGGSAYLVSDTGDITNSGSAIEAGENVALVAREGNVDLIASVGRDDKGNQKISAYDDGISVGGSIDILAKEVNITGITLSAGDVANQDETPTAGEQGEPMVSGLAPKYAKDTYTEAKSDATSDSVIRIVATEGNVNFNDIHEVSSSYSHSFEKKNPFTTRTETTTEATATSKTSSVNTDGAFIVNAAQDIVFTGGDYNAAQGAINAGNDIITKTSQDHTFKENTVAETSLEVSLKADAPGVDAVQVIHNSLSGNGIIEVEYQPQGPEGNMSNSRNKRPGAAAIADTASFSAGMKTTTVTTTDSTLTNKNASFNFSNGVDMTAGNTLDIGGMDLSAGDYATANLSGKNIISTKYEDINKSETTTKEVFFGIKGEAHSTPIDSVNKIVERVQLSISGKEVKDGMASDDVAKAIKGAEVKTDVGLTIAEVGGDVSNLIFNDLYGHSVSAGLWVNDEKESSETRTENINSIRGGQVNFNATNDINLTGVNVIANEINVEAGGDFTLSAAKGSYSSSSSSSSDSRAYAISAGVGITGAGAGASMDLAGSKSSRNIDSTAYANSSFDANNVNVNVKGDMNMTGAVITADAADVKVGGDLTITSVQDAYEETASSSNWGVSFGGAISTNGALGTVSGTGGSGDESHTSHITQQQSGIKTAKEVNVVTGGDLNLTGAHIISDSQQGAVDVNGTLNVVDLKDDLHSGGVYSGGGGGISRNGTVTGSAYYNKLDTVDYEASQHSTINVGATSGEVKGNLNTDASHLSTIDTLEVTAGNNISATASARLKLGKSNKTAKASTETGPEASRPKVSDSSSTAVQRPGTSDAAKPGKATISDSSSTAVQRPGTSDAAKPGKPAISDSSSTAIQRPGTSDVVKPAKAATNDSSSTAVQRPGTSDAAKPAKTTTSDSSSTATTETTKRPSATDTTDSGANKNQPAKKWPTVQPVKPIVGGTGSATRPGGNNHAGSAKPANNSPAQNGETGQPASASKSGGAAENSTGTGEARPAQKWPTVQPVKPIIGGTGSASRPGNINNANAAKPANNSPKANGLAAKEAAMPEQSAQAQGGNSANQQPVAAKWKVLMDNQTVEKP